MIKTVAIRPGLSWIDRFLRLMSGVACAKAAEGARGASQHPKLDSAYLLIAYRMDATPLLVSAVQNASNQTKMSAYSYGNGKLRGTWTYPGYGSWLNTQ